MQSFSSLFALYARWATCCALAGTCQVFAAAPCVAPSGDWVTAADLATVLPALSTLPADLRVSYAPVPGLVRVFHPDEMRRFARAHGLADPSPGSAVNLCAAWPLAPLSADSLRKAMEKTLEGRGPRIELLAQDKAQAPAGEIVFPLTGLSAYSEGEVIWKGYVRYSATRRFETWVRVRIRVSETHIKAQGAIHAGQRLAAGQWRAESYEGPLLREATLSDGTSLAGQVARRDFADGALLSAGFFETPKAVERGDTVTVAAGVGAARIEAPGEALSAGICGDVILIRNPRSNRTFKARIASAGRVEVLPGTTVGLAGTDSFKGKFAMTNSYANGSRVLRAFGALLAVSAPILTQTTPAPGITPPAIKKILKRFEEPSALDQFVEQAHRRAAANEAVSPGSLFTGEAVWSNLAVDLRARSIDDIVTIVVNEQASAVSTGLTKTSRSASANAAVTSLAGNLPVAGKLANLANVNSATSLNGQGTTSRQTTLTTTISARVTDVLPNGYLLIEGHRSVLVNSENQDVTIRGVIRPVDLSNANTVQSGSIAQMELRINGKGVVNDAIHRPNFIYRLFLGLLPF